MEIFLHPSSSPLLKNVNAYFFLYLVDGEYGFLDLILFLVNHFRLLNHAAPSSLTAGTLMNHACNRVLTEKGKNLTLHNFLLFHLTKHVTAFEKKLVLRFSCFASFFIRPGFQTPRNNKSTPPSASFSRCLEPLMKNSHSF